MPHPDEGQIHAWLDSALPPAEASALEAHLAACSECTAKVAEARGLIAGASRILNSLDNFPRAVAPVAVRRPYNPRLLQAAALFVVVAGGGALVARTRSSDSPLRAPSTTARVPDTIEAVVPAALPPVAAPTAAKAQRVAAKTPPQIRDKRVVAASNTAADAASDSRAAVPFVLSKAQPAVLDAVAEATLPTAAAPAPVSPLTILKTEWSALQTRTYYQVAPNKVVVLIEPGAPASMAFATAASSPSDAIKTRVGIAAASARVAARLAPESATPGDTLSWKDEPSGKTILLVGPFSAAELNDLKQRILELRAKH